MGKLQPTSKTVPVEQNYQANLSQWNDFTVNYPHKRKNKAKNR